MTAGRLVDRRAPKRRPAKANLGAESMLPGYFGAVVVPEGDKRAVAALLHAHDADDLAAMIGVTA